jgi:hypothetical protein
MQKKETNEHAPESNNPFFTQEKKTLTLNEVEISWHIFE